MDGSTASKGTAPRFSSDRVEMVPRVVSADHLDGIFNQLCLLSAAGDLRGNDEDPMTQIFYAPLALEGLFPRIRTVVSQAVGEDVLPAFSFLWLYKRGAGIHRHIDRDSSEIVASITIDTGCEAGWPIGFEPGTGSEFYVDSNRGDLVIFEGHSVYHWRNPLDADWHLQAIFNFVRANGPFAKFQFDGRKHLGLEPIGDVITNSVTAVQLALPDSLISEACGLARKFR
tara:strand:- start:3317 stop:4000 length:684 start_codon:yes stop_codon:yes gene_type:complete